MGGGFGAGKTTDAGEVSVLNCEIMCGSRRTFSVNVNSSLLCSMLMGAHQTTAGEGNF